MYTIVSPLYASAVRDSSRERRTTRTRFFFIEITSFRLPQKIKRINTLPQQEVNSLFAPVFKREKSIAELQRVAKEILRLFRMHWLTTGDALWTLVFLLVKMLFEDEQTEKMDCHSAKGASQ